MTGPETGRAADPSSDRRTTASFDPARVRVELHAGPREGLRPLFELAEDSAAQLDSYLGSGQVLVAVSGDDVVGHLQLVHTDRADVLELKSMAVREDLQGHGVGSRLVREAIRRAASESAAVLLVATAAAGVGTLRFYQRQGFRLLSVERDAFTAAAGYPPDIVIDGIELRDRVWLDYELRPGAISD